MSIILLIILLASCCYCYSSTPPQMSPVECGALYLSVNSIRTFEKFRFQRIRKALYNTTDDKIQMNWSLSTCKQYDILPDTIALFTSDPEVNNTSIPLDVVKLSSNLNYNYHVTPVSLKADTFPGGWNKKNSNSNEIVKGEPGVFCLPYWIASYKNGKLIKKNCMKIYPTWMENIKEYIKEMPLSKVILPGTHNAGSYAFQMTVPQSAIIDKFTLCQDRDIWTQLVSGIRYLDFRIGYYDTLKTKFTRNANGYTDHANKMWLNHNFIQVTPLLPLFEDIKQFLDSTTSEIVILDIHQLPVGFYQTNGDIIKDRHQHLIDLLKVTFDEHINSYSETVFRSHKASAYGPTVADILDSGKRLIIGYPDRIIYSQNKWLWPSVRHMWANTNNPYELKSYLDRVMANPPLAIYPVSNPLWSAMAETTSTIADMVTGNTIRQQADAVNRNLTVWLSSPSWWTTANIIATDFYTANNIIDEAVYFNIIKGQL